METDSPVSASTHAAGYQLTPGRSRNMAAIKRADTKPEAKLRTALHARGLRYRKDFPLRIDGRLIRPDIAFTKRKIAVFVDGCFWHSCPEHGRHPGVNKEYWTPKLRKNAERDLEQTRLLESAGWHVVRLWEHVALDDAIATVTTALLAEE